jgi:hypothetical protein
MTYCYEIRRIFVIKRIVKRTKTEEKSRQRFCIDEDSKLRREEEGNLQL